MICGRFAPSPTGRMHMGNVYCALLSWLHAKSQGGVWRLRIEDLDPQRSRKEYAMQLMDDLHWLGLEWDDEVIWQSERSDIYEHYLCQLQKMNLTYPCYCTRADIMTTQAPHESDGRIVYAGTCRGLSTPPQGRMPSTRLIVPEQTITFTDGFCGEQSINLANHCGDFVVRRADGAWAYQLAVVVDDALMGITEVVRGNDLLLSTPQQIYLYRLFGFDVPKFFHHNLLRNESGQRLSKRDKAMDMGVLRQQQTPAQLIGHLAFLAGVTDREEAITPLELLNGLSL